MGKSKDVCCRDRKLSVYFGGKNARELEGIKSNTINEWLKNSYLYNFKHIRKDADWDHGFVHFANVEDKNRFFNNMKDQDIVGPRNKIFIFGESNTSRNQSPLQPPSQLPSQLPSRSPSRSPLQPSSLSAYNIFEVENSHLIVDLYIPNIKYLDIDVSIHNLKLIYIKYKHDIIKDPGTCLKRGIIFSEDEIVLTLELPRNIDPDEKATIKYVKGVARIKLKCHKRK
ncbi:hypothetical protein C1645_808446 [Glomus cerebriforme]|uniref:SHSP domain-containing protein n=1 Tax=Glomus cerebriforme TaxID=658196 RepID=A0A397SLZ5_9GLOM|nr:hypothetical protein C1645_808446 [Glomus cerebriforme]